jgi:hypothetical protein
VRRIEWGPRGQMLKNGIAELVALEEPLQYSVAPSLPAWLQGVNMRGSGAGAAQATASRSLPYSPVGQDDCHGADQLARKTKKQRTHMHPSKPTNRVHACRVSRHQLACWRSNRSRTGHQTLDAPWGLEIVYELLRRDQTRTAASGQFK